MLLVWSESGTLVLPLPLLPVSQVLGKEELWLHLGLTPQHAVPTAGPEATGPINHD